MLFMLDLGNNSTCYCVCSSDNEDSEMLLKALEKASKWILRFFFFFCACQTGFAAAVIQTLVGYH